MGRRSGKSFALVALALCVGSAVMWVRSRRTSDVAIVVGPSGHSHAVASHRGRVVVVLSEAPAGRDKAWCVQATSIPAGDCDGVAGTILYDSGVTKRGMAGFGYAVGAFDVAGVSRPYRGFVVPDWGLVLLTGTPAVIAARGFMRRRRWARRGRCRHCGYDLRASPARCPECGEPNPGAAAVAAAAPPVARRHQLRAWRLVTAACFITTVGAAAASLRLWHVSRTPGGGGSEGAAAADAGGADAPFDPLLPEVEFLFVPFDHAIDRLAEKTGARVDADWYAITPEDLPTDEPINFRRGDVKLSECLDLLRAATNERFVIRLEGRAIVVTTRQADCDRWIAPRWPGGRPPAASGLFGPPLAPAPDSAAAAECVVRVYDVQDVLDLRGAADDAPRGEGLGVTFPWDVLSGNARGRIVGAEVVAGQLVVVAPPQQQRAVAEVLHAIRATARGAAYE